MLALIGNLFGDQNRGAQLINASARQQEAASRDDRYKQLGFDRAAKHGGETEGLRKELPALVYNRVFPEYEPSPREKQRLQSEASSYDAQTQRVEEENEALEHDIEARNQKIKNTNEELEELRAEGAYEASFDPVFWILMLLWGGLVGLLLLFYPSAAYTAMFSNFAADLQQTIAAGGDALAVVTRSIFDPAAFWKAYHQGLGTFFLILLMPIVFLSSGALLHHVLREYEGSRQKLWATALVGGVFLIDFVLAYRITSMVYEVHFLAGLVQEPWRPWYIFADVHFYLVLICGFIPHLIWAGLSYVLHNMWVEADPIRRREAQIRRWQKANDQDERRIRANEERIRDWQAILRQKRKELEGDIIPASAVVGAVEAFASGWNGFVSASGRRVQRRTKEVNAAVEAFLSDLQARLGIKDSDK